MENFLKKKKFDRASDPESRGINQHPKVSILSSLILQGACQAIREDGSRSLLDRCRIDRLKNSGVRNLLSTPGTGCERLGLGKPTVN